VPYGRTESAAETAAVLDALRQAIGASEPWQQFQKNSQLQVVVVDKHLRRAAYDEAVSRDWRKVQQRIQSDRLLANAWVELAGCQDYAGNFTHYDVLVRIDSLVPQVDESRVKKLVEGSIERELRVAEVTRIPLTNLLRSVNLALESSPRLNGCFVESANVALRDVGGEAKYCLVLRGQIAEEQQRQVLSSIVGKIMQQQPDWKRQLEREDFLTLLDELKEIPSSTYVGKQLYAQALSEYRRGNFEEATELFRRAVTAAPANLDWRYWYIVSLLQQGKDTEAKDHMRSIVARSETSRARSEIARSLERVQGTIRQRLMTLENEAMTTSSPR
jgi:tetratricopeptide (TPR) repeat protein